MTEPSKELKEANDRLMEMRKEFKETGYVKGSLPIMEEFDPDAPTGATIVWLFAVLALFLLALCVTVVTVLVPLLSRWGFLPIT